MKRLTVIATMFLFGLTNLAGATGEEIKFVSKTFEEIKARTIRRDAACDAILAVNAKADAPTLGFGLDFSIEEIPHTGEAVIVLGRRLKSGDGVFEKYRLRLDEAMRQELRNQKRLKVLEGERQAKGVQSQKQNIVELSAGKLHYGMSLEEVVEVKGKPQTIQPWQQAGASTVLYPDMILMFSGMKLIFLELRKQ